MIGPSRAGQYHSYWSWWRNLWDTPCISILRILISGNCYIRNVWTCNQRTFNAGCARKRSAQEWTLWYDLELHGVCHAASRQRKAGLIPRVVLNTGRGTVFESGIWKLVHTRSWIIFAQFASPIELFLLYFSAKRRQVFEQDGKAGEWEDIRSWCLQIQTNLKWYRLSGKRLQKKQMFFCGTCEVSIVSILPDGTWNSSFCHLGVTGSSHRAAPSALKPERPWCLLGNMAWHWMKRCRWWSWRGRRGSFQTYWRNKKGHSRRFTPRR